MTRKMTMEYARELLGLQSDNDFNTLQQHYRELLRKYHPDQHQGKTAFYTIMTGRINEAYRLLKTEFKHPHTQSPAQDEPPTETDVKSNSRTMAQAATEATTYTMRHSVEADGEHKSILRGSDPHYPRIIDSIYRPYITSAQEAICHYYSYNLPNVHLRDEGTTRTHFRVIQKKFATLLRKFEQHIDHKKDYDTDSHYYFLFWEAFFNNIQSELRIRTSLNKNAYKLLKIYRDSTQILDSAIEECYCSTRRNTRTLSIDSVLLAEQTFRQLAEEDNDFGFRDIAVTKQNLATAFLKTLYWKYTTQ